MFDYSTTDNHILKRDGLPSIIRETLLESTRNEWSAHPRFRGKASFFMNIHRDLINGAAQLSADIEALLDIPEGELAENGAFSNLVNFGGRLISFAHHHHEIEDHGYFPQLRLIYPNMDRAMTLLDGDHKILDAALNDTNDALHQITHAPMARDRIAQLHRGSKAVESILNRHIWDEEEIIIPIFLKHS
jgi:hypothetical protein